jgi:glutamine amidotransferase-like uncharacterized protein
MRKKVLAFSRLGTIFTIIALLIPLSIMASPQMLAAQPWIEQSRTDLNGINVAVYYDEGALGSSVFALYYMFEWMNASVSYIDAEEIQADALDNYDLVAFPGGSTFDYNNQLDALGRTKLTDFVANGGSFFGICGGSMLGTHTTGLGLFNGFYSSAVAGIGPYLMDLAVNRTSTGPDLSDEPVNYTTMYWGSAYFYGPGLDDAIPIMTYHQNGEAAMIACRYEYGTVFLSSPHPEYEEGDERDGTDFYDHLDDPDSEWGLMLKVSIWLVEAAESPPTTTTTTTSTTTTATTTSATTSTTTTTTTTEPMFPLEVAAIAGGIAILAIVAIVLIRRR